jgi:predicted nucleotidyltransferase
MTSSVQKLSKLGLIHPPKWLPDNLHYETIMGSIAYGVATDDSDWDVYGFCIPPKDDVFPHLRGEITGFGRQMSRFEQYQEQHIILNGREYDLSIYSIVRFFHLAMENNPNMVDALYTPANCVLHITKVGQMVRDNRDMFLHKGYYHKARGYAFSQLARINRPGAEGKRKELVDTYGYDVKFAYHIVRLLDQVEQVLESGTVNLQRSKEVLKAIRGGVWTEDQVREYFNSRERDLADLYTRSTLRYSPDEQAIKNLLLACLEEHYGSLSTIISLPGRERDALEQIIQIASGALWNN